MSSVFNGIVTGMTAPGGWHYPQALRSGQTIRIEGQGYDDLERKVLDFRLRQVDLVPVNTSTLEDVQADLKHYICTNFPNSCVDPTYDRRRPQPAPVPPDAPAPFKNTAFVPLINRVNAWFQGLAYRTLERVDAGVANRRAEICAGCPLNLTWATSCSPCNDSVTKMGFTAQAGVRVQNESALKACRSFGDYLPTAIWLKDTFSVARHSTPDFCWRKP